MTGGCHDGEASNFIYIGCDALAALQEAYRCIASKT
jgi:hypothetical protein